MQQQQQQRKVTDIACKAIIKDIAAKFTIDPILITTKLMSEDDKNDLRSGELSPKILELHVKAWIALGMPNHRAGEV
jgi:hypothetical protein